MCARDLDFCIVGTMKSGTSSIAEILKSHPNIAIPKKEIHYYDTNSHLGIDWYKRHFIGLSDNCIVGEATSAYSIQTHCPYLLSKDFPSCKILWIFRDPIKRTYSNWMHVAKTGKDARSFNQAIKDELYQRELSFFKSYIKRSLYGEQVVRWLDFFDETQMHFATLEDLIENPRYELNKICDFLEVKKDFRQEQDFPKANATALPREVPIYSILSTFIPNNILNKVWSFERPVPPMGSGDRKVLKEIFKPDVARLSSIVGKDLVEFWQLE